MGISSLLPSLLSFLFSLLLAHCLAQRLWSYDHMALYKCVYYYYYYYYRTRDPSPILYRSANLATNTMHKVKYITVTIKPKFLLKWKWNKILVNSCADKNVWLFQFCFSVRTCETSSITFIRWVSRDSIVDGDLLRTTDWCHRYELMIRCDMEVAKKWGAWSGKTWKFCEQFLLFFWKTTPYGKFSKFCSDVHIATPIDVVV